MKVFSSLCLGILLLGVSALVYSGDSGDPTCYGYTSTTSHFECGAHGNCTWWVAYKRPDIARVISGSGWNGGEWYDKLRGKGFDVGSQPKVDAIVEFSSPGHHGFEFDRARFVAYNQDMEQMKKDRKDWQSILLWSLVISGLLFFTLVACFFSDHCTKQEEWIYFAFTAFFVLWGGFLEFYI